MRTYRLVPGLSTVAERSYSYLLRLEEGGSAVLRSDTSDYNDDLVRLSGKNARLIVVLAPAVHILILECHANSCSVPYFYFPTFMLLLNIESITCRYGMIHIFMPPVSESREAYSVWTVRPFVRASVSPSHFC